MDVDLGNVVKSGIQALVRSTHGPQVLGKIGGFGGLFRADFGKMKDPVLVASVDGVGTKLKVAFMVNKHDTVGQDLVNHCINDIAVVGAQPLFFLDYVAAASLEPPVFRQLLTGFAKACRAGSCALIGGETAQMPGMYQAGEYDVAGTIVGVVDRPKMLDGSKVRVGDVLIGLPSAGLHTNGYSLARKVLFETMGLKVSSRLPELKLPIGEELLRVHKNYQPLMASLPDGCSTPPRISPAAASSTTSRASCPRARRPTSAATRGRCPRSSRSSRPAARSIRWRCTRSSTWASAWSSSSTKSARPRR